MCCRGSEASPFRGVPRGETPLGDSLVTFSSGRKSPGAWGGAPIHGEECRGRGASPSSQKAPRSPGSYKFPEDSVSIKENKSSTSSRFKSRRWCLCLPSE